MAKPWCQFFLLIEIRETKGNLYRSTLDASNEVTANIDQLNIARCVYYHQKKLEENPNISCLPEEMMIPDDLKIFNPTVMYKKGRSPFEDVNYAFRSIAILARSQIGYELRQTDAKVRARLLKTVVCGGNVKTPGQERLRESQAIAGRTRHPMNVLGPVNTVTAGIETFAKLIGEGVYPGYGGHEVSALTSEKNVFNDNPFKVIYDPANVKPAKKKVKDGITQAEEDFLIKAAQEVGVVFPDESASSPDKEIKPIVGHTNTRRQEVYRPVVPKDYKISVGTSKSVMNSSRERAVPSSRLARVANFGMLAFGLGGGALAEVTRRTLGITREDKFNSTVDKVVSPNTNPFLTEANAERIVGTLCRVRGAALKLGQMLSIQDEDTVPAYLLQILERVRQNADFMPTYQVHRQLENELGSDWRQLFLEFDEKPFAAASIGQVHKAVARDGKQVAVKIQYPGVADSIDSDINNLISVLNIGNLFPKGMFLDNFISVMRRELKWECDYEREAKAMSVFQKLFEGEKDYFVPRLYPALSTKRVLTGEYVVGKTIDSCINEPQAVRDYISAKFIELCMKEIFIWRFMQTDPNWSNFLFGSHPVTNEPCLILLDFGASRSYKKIFVDRYMRIIKATYDEDEEKILKYSREIGFLTGYESKLMEKAHCDSTRIMGEVLTSRKPYDFALQNVTKRITPLIPVMLEHRLTSPPDEIYSLHRKLSGSHLIATKLKAVVSCGAMFDEIFKQYKFGEYEGCDDPLDPVFKNDY
uniref:ABC1 atypical kinase-like domain-containing protein n=1 Tax=Ditylenchus dipsaci TaxID=166011 RepID=A0A915EJU5_9BILA